MKTFFNSGAFSLILGFMLLIMYSFDRCSSTLFFAGVEFGLGLYLLLDFLMSRFVRSHRAEKQISVYVDPATYDRLQLMAAEFDLSLATFCSCALEAIDPDDLAAAGEEMEVSGDG